MGKAERVETAAALAEMPEETISVIGRITVQTKEQRLSLEQKARAVKVLSAVKAALDARLSTTEGMSKWMNWNSITGYGRGSRLMMR